MEPLDTNKSSLEEEDSLNNEAESSSQKPKKEKGFVSEIISFSLIAFLIVLPIRFFVAQPFIVSGASMENTFHTGEYLIVDQLSYRFHDPERGDVIIFRYPKDPSKFFIKRIIAVPGDTIDIEGDVVTIINNQYPSGFVIDEPYVKSMDRSTTLTEELGDEEYFVMGDNRDASSDSRMWGILSEDKIIGIAFLRLFPFTEIDYMPGEYDIEPDIMSGE